MEPVSRFLFGEGTGVYAVLDGASIPGLLDKLYGERRPEFECLYRGEIAPDMAQVAPYLVRLRENDEFTDWVLGQGWGKHWGIFLQGQEEMTAMRLHLRRFLVVHTTEGKPLYFRYYDPRVLRTFLPTCTGEELEKFFGPVKAFFLEAEDPKTLLKFRFSGKLIESKEQLAPVPA